MILFLKNLLFTIIVPGTVAGFLPWWLFRPYELIAGSVTELILGGVMTAAGIILYTTCIWPFASVGRGTPAPIDAPVELVVVGPYRFVRNPMYIAVLLVIFGQSVLTRSPGMAAYGLCVGACFSLVVIGYEEQTLRSQFGEAYERYCNRVPRWLPRVPGEDMT